MSDECHVRVDGPERSDRLVWKFNDGVPGRFRMHLRRWPVVRAAIIACSGFSEFGGGGEHPRRFRSGTELFRTEGCQWLASSCLRCAGAPLYFPRILIDRLSQKTDRNHCARSDLVLRYRPAISSLLSSEAPEAHPGPELCLLLKLLPRAEPVNQAHRCWRAAEGGK